MNIPKPGDEIFVDCDAQGAATDVWHKPADGMPQRITDGVTTDMSKPKEFVVRGKHPPNIYSTTPPWQVICDDDPESTGAMRRGRVRLETWAY